MGINPASSAARMGGGVHLMYLADVAQLGVGDAAGQHAVVDAAQPDAPATQLLQQGDQLLVDQAAQHGYYDLQTVGVGHPQAAHELRRDALALHPAGDDVTAAVHHHDLLTLLLQLDQVQQRGVVAAKRAAADFHYDGQSRTPVTKV